MKTIVVSLLLLAVCLHSCIPALGKLDLEKELKKDWAGVKAAMNKQLGKVSEYAKSRVDKVKAEVELRTHWSADQKKELDGLVSELNMAGASMVNEEVKLERSRDTLNKFVWAHPFWFLKKDLYEKHEVMVKDVRAHARDVAAKHEQVDSIVRKIKGLNGIYSLLFVEDVVGLLVSPFFAVFSYFMDTLFATLLAGLMSFLPVLALFTLSYAFLRAIMFPIIGLIYITSVMFQLPPLVLEYHPKVQEFAIIMVVGYMILSIMASGFVGMMSSRSEQIYIVDARKKNS